MGTAQSAGTNFGKSYVPDVSSFYHLRHCPYRILNWHIGVNTSWTVYIDVVCSQPTQRIGQKILDGSGTGIIAMPAAFWVTENPELYADGNLFSLAPP